MYIGYIIIFTLLLISCVSCIIIFRNYKKEYALTLNKGDIPLRLLSGVCLSICDMLERGRNPNSNKLLHKHRIRVISYIILMFLICVAIGLVYLISLELKDVNSIASVTRPDAGEGDTTMTIITENDTYSGPLDITVEERQYSFDEVIQLFSTYREKLDEYVLGDNSSFLNVTLPLTFPSTIGKENITISWFIADTDIVDYGGELNYENISIDGSETDITATLTLGDISADIFYHIKAFPKKLDSKTLLTEYIESLINSESNASDINVSLPTEMNGSMISYEKHSTPLPP